MVWFDGCMSWLSFFLCGFLLEWQVVGGGWDQEGKKVGWNEKNRF